MTKRLVFSAVDAINGEEFWITDGTAAGTLLLKDINPGITGSQPFEFRALGTKVLFNATDGTHGSELWVTDGTQAGTQLLKDINPGAGDSFPRTSRPLATSCSFKLATRPTAANSG